MPLSNSVWDRGVQKRLPSPAFLKGPGRVLFEFENRRSEKIFSHTLGRVEFRPGLGDDIVSGRNEQISAVYGQRGVDGYRYKSVSHVHIKPELLGPDLTVLGHGVPIASGWENCAMIGAVCKTGNGIDSKCEVGKCEIGRLDRISGDKWRYESLTVPGVYYYVFGTEKVVLKSITKGRFRLPAGEGVVDIDRVASVPATVYVPPASYSQETFTRRVVTTLYSGSDRVRSLTDSVDNFTRSLLGTNQSTVDVEVEVRDRLLSALQPTLDPTWYEFLSAEVDEVWRDRYTGVNMSNRDFAIRIYSVLTTLYQSAIEVMMSGIKGSRVTVDGSISRPVYNRLPGVEGAYNSEDSPENPAKWLVSGADDVLSSSKSLLDTFYRTYLNPDTCYPLNLDWIAQHLGFVGGLWNLEWPNATKRLLLRNAHVNHLEVGSLWTLDSEQDTFRKIDLGRIERVNVDTGTGEVSMAYRYSGRTYDVDTSLSTLDTFNSLVIDSSRWQGLLPSRGSLLTLMFMFWALGIKAHSPEELKYDSESGTFLVRSGLRDREVSSPVNTPYIVDVLRVGSETDAEVENYPNQLIADIGTCQDELSANTTVIRMPFYYNRNGRTWDAAVSIMNNYAPSTTINRVQYAYSAADLLVADDIFFEPEVEV